MIPKASWNTETAHREGSLVFRFIRSLCMVGVVFRFAAGARAQEHRSVDAFGNSLSDAGNVIRIPGPPRGTGFADNPEPVRPEILAPAFGSPDRNSLSGGTNHPFGGASAGPGRTGSRAA